MEQLEGAMVWLMRGIHRLPGDTSRMHYYDRKHKDLVGIGKADLSLHSTNESLSSGDGAAYSPETVNRFRDILTRLDGQDKDLIVVPRLDDEDRAELMQDFIELSIDRSVKRRLIANFERMRSDGPFDLAGFVEGIEDEAVRQEWALSVQGSLEVMAAQFAEEHGIDLEEVQIFPAQDAPEVSQSPEEESLA